MAYQINLTGQEIDERLQNVGTAKDKAAADGTLYARISKNAVDIADHEKRLNTLDNSGGASPMVAARLRLGVNTTGQPFRIHGKGLLPTDEVRLYRNVHSMSHFPDENDTNTAIKRKGWREVKYLGKGENNIAFPYLELATDVMENSPLANEVNVCVRVEQNGQEVYTGELIDFFVDYYLYIGTGQNTDEKDALYIRNGRKTKKISTDDSTGEYYSTARTVDWAVLVLRDGNPITDFMPFKWLVETAIEISAPMDIQACIDDTLKVSAVPYNHYAGNGASETAKLPDLNVVTGVGKVMADLDAITLTLSQKNLKAGTATTAAAVFAAAGEKAGVMTAAMVRQLDELYADYIQRKYSGQNVVVLEYDESRFADKTAQFNGKTYDVSDGFCVLDLGEKKTINNKTADERKFVSAITNVQFLPEGITNYDDAFNPGSANSNPFKVTAKVDMGQCTSAARMFLNQKGLTELDVSYWDVSKMKTFSYMFAITGLKTLDVSGWDVSAAVYLDRVFSTTLFETLDTSKWKTPMCTNLACMFQSTALLTIDVSSLDTSKVTDMHYMFYSWNGSYSARDKKIVGLVNFNTSKVTNFNAMFAGLKNVTLDLTSFSLESAENVNAMFAVDEAAIAKQYVTLGSNFFNAPKLSAFDLSSLKMSAELRQSLIDCFDRKAAGQQTLTLSLPTTMLSGVTALTEEEKAAIKAKGYELA